MTIEPVGRRLAGVGSRAVLVIGLVVVASLVVGVLVLHARSGYPGTAKRLPVGMTDDRRANGQIVQRAARVSAALAAGDTATLRSLAFDESERGHIAQLVAAFGNRADTIADVRVDEVGGMTGALTISVPCKAAPAQQIVIPFVWRRTSWLSSGWFALYNEPGSAGQPQPGCPSP